MEVARDERESGGATRSEAGIVWIASYPKSGNTWVRAFLFNLLNLLKAYDPTASSLNALSEYSVWDVSATRYTKVLGKPPKEAGRRAVAIARPKVQEMIADELEGLSLTKTHNALVMDHGVPTINMRVTSGAIYLVRNPLDVAISYSHHLGVSIDNAIARMAADGHETDLNDKVVPEIYGSWSQNVHSWTRKPNRAIYVMRYEDLKANPSAAFAGLAQHLLLRPSKRDLRKAIELSSFERLQRLEREDGFAMKPDRAEVFFRKGLAGEWKERLTDAQVRRIVGRHRTQMARFGYVPEGY